MDWITGFTSTLNDTTVKWVLLLVGGFILKKWPAFVNKAIPLALTILSGLIALLSAMFPPVPVDAVPGMFVAASFAGQEVYAFAGFGSKLGSVLLNTVVPVALAIGTQSGSKNTREWFTLLGKGVGMIWPQGRPSQ